MGRRRCTLFQALALIASLALLASPAAAQTILFSESFDSAWTTPSTLESPSCASPPCFWNGQGSGDTEWHRWDYVTGWSGSGGGYSPSGANGTTHSARFHSSEAPAGTSGSLRSPWISIWGTRGPLAVSFWYINPSGTDSLFVSYSHDGVNYRRVLRLGTAATWTRCWANVGPAGFFSSLQVEFVAVSDDGTTDIGLDDLLLIQGLAGTTPVGPDERLTTLTEAVAEYDSATAVLAPAAYRMTSAYQGIDTELLPLTLISVPRSGGNHTVTFGPEPGTTATTSGSSSSAVFVLDGADWMVLDGGDGWNVTNTNTAGGIAAVWLRQGASNNVLRDLTVSCSGIDPRFSTLESFGFLLSGSALTNSSDGTDNDANTLEDNTVTNVQWGIYARGALGNPNDNNVIRRNVVGPAVMGPGQIRRGAIIGQHQSGLIITENDLHGLGLQGSDPATGTDVTAIGAGSNVWAPAATAMVGATITRNTIHTVINGKGSSACGIVVASSVSPSNNTIANNQLRNILANGTGADQAVGIGIGAGSGDRVVFNSLRLYGDLDAGVSATQSAAAIRIQSASAANLTVKNNAVAIGWTSNTGTLRHFAEVVPSTGFAWGTGGNNHNDYYVDPISAQTTLGGIGTAVPYTPVTTLAAWRTQFTPNQDGASIDTPPPFTSSTNLHIQPGIPTGIESGGTPISGVTVDFDGDLRNVSAPDIGFDEGSFTGVSANHAPEFREHFDLIPRWGKQTLVTLQAHDRDCLPLTYSASGLPAGASINPSTGRITWNVSQCPGDADGSFTAYVTDSCGLSDTLEIAYHPRPGIESSCFVRRDYVPKCTNYPADSDGDFAEDQATEGAPEDSVEVWLVFNRCRALEGENRDSVEVYARIVFEADLVAAALVKTRRSNIPHLTGMSFVSLVTVNHSFRGALTMSGQVMGIRTSPDYQPSTVEDSLKAIDGTGSTVVIIDVGVDGNHESLVGKYRGGVSFTLGTGDSTSGDPAALGDHGTSMAGAAVGRGSPTFTNIGMAKNANYVDVRVLIPNGSGGYFGSEVDVIAALQYAQTLGAGTIVYLGIEGDDLSYGADPSVLWNGTDLLSTAIDAATQLGLIVVVPVGNVDPANTPLLPPAVAENAIVVAASAHQNTVTWIDDEIGTISKFGPREPDGDGDSVDEEIPHIAAPGTDLNVGGTGIVTPKAGTLNQYVGVKGTSVAAAQVAGILALMQQVVGGGGNLPMGQARQLMMDTADEVVPPAQGDTPPTLDALAWGPAWGHGLVNAFRLIDRLVPLANVGFDVYCMGPGEWYFSSDIEVLDPILIGDSVRVRVHIHNKSMLRSISNFTIELGQYHFGNGPFEGTFHTFRDNTTLLPPGGHLWFETKWYVSPILEDDHGCLKASLTSPRDGGGFDNCAQRNVDIIGYGSSNVAAGESSARPTSRTNSPPPVSRMFVANLLPENVEVQLVPTLVTGSGWTLVCSETTLAFPMLRNEPPREVTWRGVPGVASTDSAVWSIQVNETGVCAAWNSGGVRVVARKSELTDVGETIVQMPTLRMVPQPFRESLELTFVLPKPGPVKFGVFDVMGREVWSIDLGTRPAGVLRWKWDGRMHGGVDASPGVYFTRAQLGGVELGGRVVRLR